uniref:Beta-amylase n=1 Tax=Oryza glumipatula TaxID=40148 RepID=A0A0D9Z7D4_9ORYZ
MEAVLMQQAAAAAVARPARRRCAGEEVVGGRRPGLVRLGFARRRWSRLRLSPARAHLAVDRSREAGEEAAAVVEEGEAALLGVDGVELPVSWAVAQPGPTGDELGWAGYLAVAAMVRDAGLCLRVSLDTHGSALPAWVAAAAAADPDILFADRSGNRRDGCLSFAVDELPVLGGKSPLQAYEAFFRSFAAAFHDFLGSTVTDVTVSLGPNGELKYPSYPPGSDGAGGYGGAGEFQCYDRHMLARLKRHAVAAGQPLWGLSGPHDAPRYGESPESSTFFRSPGGSWETAYGGFFLSWYAGELLAHGDRVLAAARRVFDGEPVELSAKVPLPRSRPAEATAGLHGGYGPVAEMFARRGCTRTRPCHFTYQRMGAEFFSPDHWPLFVQLVRAMECPEEAHEDDLPAAAGDGGRLAVPSGGRAAEDATAKQAQTV